MRKKLFAVIMSAMMMITFMPAMAFAATTYPTAPSRATEGEFVISGLTGSYYDAAGHYAPSLVYDGQDTEVKYVPYTFWEDIDETPGAPGGHYDEKVLACDVQYVVTQTGVPTLVTKDAPKFKNAGTYRVNVSATYKIEGINPVTDEPSGILHTETDEKVLTLTINARDVLVTVAKNVTLTKDYDGKGFTLDDSFFNVSALPATSSDSEAVKAWKAANTGLVAGDKLVTKAYTTPVDVDTYYIGWNSLVLNPNYNVYELNGAGTQVHADFTKYVYTVKIIQADNEAKIASNTLTIKRGSSKAVKFSTTWGTKKLTKLSGNTKISVKNGKVYVKKGLKKGTYKIKVKASAAGTKNWVKASRIKTLTIKVK